MNWNMIKWVMGLLFVMGLIVATNLIDKKNFNKVGDSIENIYNDRLVAKDLIFDISLLIHEKAMARATADSLFFEDRNHKVNQKIDELIALYSDTKLTEDEERVFENLKVNVNKMEQLEVGSTSSSLRGEFFVNEPMSRQLKKIQDNLYVLSKIQIEEGKRQMLMGKTAVRSVDFLTQMEIYLLIALAIVAQLLLISGIRLKKSTS